ncbi:NAD(P)H-binding protein [Flammeovirgaceae bacterium SG7u.111]|nr:NAD(P)H-binding protein [Flammeovirgaceae bacterium SG7u.132]WPO36693.1 NAD(P)H-binding protein [Flammeovirgaceae bacterium SG7u.111]
MKNVLITGATGMVGAIVLRNCLESPEIEKVTSISRKPLGISHPKLEEVVHSDFLDYSTVEHHFQNQDAAYFCIGVYTGQVPDSTFKTITVDYTKTFADVLVKNSPTATFCFLSGAGADPKEKSKMSFARYKGMAENYLLKLGFEHVFIFRPGYIYPVEKRKEPNVSYRIFRSLYPMLKGLMANSSITSEELGKAMFQAGLSGAGKTILENKDIKEI